VLSGWPLFALTLFLAIYNVRRKLTYPPLGSSASWLRFHLHVGTLAALLFLIHIGFQPPRGQFESALGAVFVFVAGSGFLGIFLSRQVPPRLAVVGPEVLFERIAMFRRQLRQEAESLAVRSVEQTNTRTLANFYALRLAPFFAAPRHFWHHVAQSQKPAHRLLEELRALDRYLDEDEKKLARELGDLVETNDGLDYHYAMQGLLKGWLFVHVPLTYVLLLLVLAHVVIVGAFRGGPQ
jgi:hypothetical protein